MELSIAPILMGVTPALYSPEWGPAKEMTTQDSEVPHHGAQALAVGLSPPLVSMSIRSPENTVRWDRSQRSEGVP